MRHQDNRRHPPQKRKMVDPVKNMDELDGPVEDKIEGRNPVLEALKSDRTIHKIFIAKGQKTGSILQIITIARQKGVVFQEVDPSKLDQMALTNAHQGVIAFVSAKEYVEVEDLLAYAQSKREPPFLVILDGITDPQNLGSIIRTANAVGAHGVIIPKRRSAGITPVVVKASAGAVEYVHIAKVTNISQTIETLKSKNIWVVGTDSNGKDSLYQSNLTGPIAVVIGGEGSGIGRLVADSCDFIVHIPMKGEISSLNAGVAGALLMYEVFRQRGSQ